MGSGQILHYHNCQEKKYRKESVTCHMAKPYEMVKSCICLPAILEQAAEHCTVINPTPHQAELHGYEEQPPGAESAPACSEPGYLLQYKRGFTMKQNPLFLLQKGP